MFLRGDYIDTSVLRQKGGSENRCFKKTKHGIFSKKTKISYPLIRTSTQRVKYVCFWKIWRGLFSWNTLFEIRPFALLPTNNKKWFLFHLKTKSGIFPSFFHHCSHQRQNLMNLHKSRALKKWKHDIWGPRDCNWTRTYSHLVCKPTLNHLASKIFECSFTN